MSDKTLKQQLQEISEARSDISVHKMLGDKVTAGDVVWLKVYPPNNELSDAVPSQWASLANGPVEFGTGRILSWKPPQSSSDPYISIFLTSYTPGDFEIGPIVFLKDGKAVFSSQPQKIKFESLGIKDEEKQQDIYEPGQIEYPMWVAILFGVVLFAVAIVLSYIGYKIYKKYIRPKFRKLKSEPILTPIEQFNKTLLNLNRENNLDKGLFKAHYFKLSDAVKKLIASSFYFDAEEQTTRELLSELRQHFDNETLHLEWKNSFESLDLVKFTDFLPTSDDARSFTGQVKTLVEQTYLLSKYYAEEVERERQKQLKLKTGSKK